MLIVDVNLISEVQGIMYEAITNSIRICVEPSFIEEQSHPEENYFFWAYKVDIENLGTQTVQLHYRTWQITDASGVTEKVEGIGVIGQEPIIAPGTSFSYTSCAPLNAPSGVMRGFYSLRVEDGEDFEAEIPAFSLDSPYADRRLN